MTPLRTITAAALVTAFAATALAQARAATPPSTSAASAAAMGMGGGMHNSMRKGGPRTGPDNTPGWNMMTPQEREQHRKDMQSAKSHDECKSLMDKHHQQMADRAKERGMKMADKPKHDACAGMK